MIRRGAKWQRVGRHEGGRGAGGGDEGMAGGSPFPVSKPPPYPPPQPCPQPLYGASAALTEHMWFLCLQGQAVGEGRDDRDEDEGVQRVQRP